MMKRIRVSTEGLSRMQNELRKMRGVINSNHKKRQMHTCQPQDQTSGFASTTTSTTTVKARPRPQGNPEVPQNTPRKKTKSDMQNLADIILRQAHRIEKQQRELQCLKQHYERQVSTIKSNAEILEQQLHRLQSNVKKTRALQLDHHRQEISSAVEKLQKCGLDLSQPQVIANHLLTKLLSCKTN
ncbi:hypothetical protein KR054_010627 [Drosophila jambulina]|nr:hypothetical protein KR054_010627 [Drosophila jambulina]